jgi:hypothetical protein
MSAPRDSLGSTMMLMTDSESELHQFELFLRGMEEDKNKELTPVGEPICNDYGVSKILGLGRSVANKNFEFSHHEIPEINNLLMYNGDNMVKLLMVRQRDFGIKDDAARSSILTYYMDLVYSALLRGKEGGERSFWKGTVLELRQQSINNAGKTEQSGGIFSKLFRK